MSNVSPFFGQQTRLIFTTKLTICLPEGVVHPLFFRNDHPHSNGQLAKNNALLFCHHSFLCISSHFLCVAKYFCFALFFVDCGALLCLKTRFKCCIRPHFCCYKSVANFAMRICRNFYIFFMTSFFREINR